jgi:hypothetical protein
VTERSKPTTKNADVSGLVASSAYDLTKAESPDERASRLRREEAETDQKLRSKAAEDAHERRLSLIVPLFVMAVVAIAFLASTSIAVAKDPKSGLPDQAVGLIIAIVTALVGDLTGKNSK